MRGMVPGVVFLRSAAGPVGIKPALFQVFVRISLIGHHFFPDNPPTPRKLPIGIVAEVRVPGQRAIFLHLNCSRFTNGFCIVSESLKPTKPLGALVTCSVRESDSTIRLTIAAFAMLTAD